VQHQHSTKIAEPATYQEALQSEHADLWKAAIDDEMASILSNDTWEVVEPPPGANIIGSKWVLKVKYDTSGQVDRFKARLVAQGYKQVEGVEYNEVFAPVSKYTTIRTMLALAAAENIELELLDIKTAFLNGTLQEEVYPIHAWQAPSWLPTGATWHSSAAEEDSVRTEAGTTCLAPAPGLRVAQHRLQALSSRPRPLHMHSGQQQGLPDGVCG
jgi:hypothetical protein